MHLNTGEVTAIAAVIGSLIAMGTLTYYVGKLVSRIETLIAQKEKDHQALHDRINNVESSMDRHETWHMNNPASPARKR